MWTYYIVGLSLLSLLSVLSICRYNGVHAMTFLFYLTDLSELYLNDPWHRIQVGIDLGQSS
jgi:hypothetical protein